MKEDKNKKSAKKEEIKKTPDSETMKATLPQNILPMGEYVEADKNIYIHQSVYKEIHKYTKNKTENESGGFLIGNVVEDFGKTNIIIKGFIEAKHCEGTPTTLKFTHDTWDYCHKMVDKKFPDMKIVGWIHTHPDFGIFLSNYDKFIQSNFFAEDYEIAYVVDPIQKIEGFYFWINGNIERCKGFYIFDETSRKINIKPEENESEKPKEEKKSLAVGGINILNIILIVLVIILGILVLSLNNKVNGLSEDLQEMESVQEQLIYSHNNLANFVQTMIPEETVQEETVQEETVQEETVPEETEVQ